MTKRRELSAAAFAKLQDQVSSAMSLCSETQMLTLADQIHDAIRRLRNVDQDSVEIDVIPQQRRGACS